MSSTFNVIKINGTALPGYVDGVFDERETDDVRTDDGALHPTSATVRRAAPKAEFGTVCVRTLFGVLSTGDEVPFAALDGTNGVEMIGAEGDTAPGLASGSVHARRKFLNGLLMLDGISWRQDSLAIARCSVFAKAAAGGTDPVTRTAVAAPTIPVNTERLVLIAATINGVNALPKLQSADLTIDHKVENNDPSQSCYDGGLPWPVALAMPGAAGAAVSKLVLETQDLTTAFANGTVVLTFGVLNAASLGVSANTAIVTLNNCFVRSRLINGPAGAATRRLEIQPVFDGTNRPCTLSVA
jgi:hypothetical protein